MKMLTCSVSARVDVNLGVVAHELAASSSQQQAEFLDSFCGALLAACETRTRFELQLARIADHLPQFAAESLAMIEKFRAGEPV